MSGLFFSSLQYEVNNGGGIVRIFLSCYTISKGIVKQ